MSQHHPPLDSAAAASASSGIAAAEERPRARFRAPRRSLRPSVVERRQPGDGREKVPRPVSESRPRKISEPSPAASRPGTSTRPSIGPPSPDASSSRNAPTSGEPSSELIAAKLPVAPITAAAVAARPRRAVARQHAEPAADRDQRRLRAEHHAQRRAWRARRADARELDGRQRPRGLEAVGGRVAPGAREVADREPDSSAAEGEQRQRPPHRRGVEPERLGQVGEHRLLQLVDEHEEQ